MSALVRAGGRGESHSLDASLQLTEADFAEAAAAASAGQVKRLRFRYGFDATFFYGTLMYTTVALFVLPIVGCTALGCPRYDGVATVSSLIHRVPLATAYAYCGALWLMCIMYLQMDSSSRPWKSVLAFAGGKFLAMPLILPLQSVHGQAFTERQATEVHDYFALGGAVVQWLIMCALLFEVRVRHNVHVPAYKRRALYAIVAGFAVLTLSIVLGIVFAWRVVSPYALLVCEYFFGASLVWNTLFVHYYTLDE